jgi:histidine decarboxylase
MKLKDVVNGAVGAFPSNCAGYLNPGTSGLGYIATLKLSIGVAQATTDDVLEEIVAYDSAETSDAYIGQINMVQASSFCGLNGAVWGYDLAKADDLYNNFLTLRSLKRHDKKEILIQDVTPLLNATKRLFGIHTKDKDQRRFPPLPGAMVGCAYKNKTVKIKKQEESKTLWCAIALAIAEDRGKDSCLFIEDVGDYKVRSEELRDNIVHSIRDCGENQGVLYKEIFWGYKEAMVKPGQIGVALSCAPYVTLARNAIPHGYKSEDLINMTISDWERALNLSPLKNDFK